MCIFETLSAGCPLVKDNSHLLLLPGSSLYYCLIQQEIAEPTDHPSPINDIAVVKISHTHIRYRNIYEKKFKNQKSHFLVVQAYASKLKKDKKARFTSIV